MKKKILIAVIILSSFLIINALSNKDTRLISKAGMEKSVLNNQYSLSEDISLSLKDAPFSLPLPEFLVIVYTDNSDSQWFSYGEHFWLEKNLNNTWYTFPESVAHDMLYTLGPHTTGEVDCYISQYHEYLNSGLYRIVCTVKRGIDKSVTEIVTCEFEIKDNGISLRP